ncbi:hypothetical protein I0P70_13265 [Pontibacter sp. FD36]|uniref:hypothetical protein n=1 Tax=Pontibacter sp. FD36 TaxID=2789860 RepID=UPI0018ABB093|nr:hypothetical protein [Pontibacter sp. FD36]MBF8964218.1 hypothetical protein [Pontibacter sp. FD36]
MNAIGGYFELELRRGEELHANAIKLNTGRNAFKYILLANSYSKVYIPFYTCEVMLEPIEEMAINYEFYSVDSNLEPIFNFDLLKENEAFLYTNYFGLKDKYLKKLKNTVDNLIVDNAQAFFSLPLEGAHTFYSPRKFFGVSDGAYLYTDKLINNQLEIDYSFERLEHLMRRIENNAEDGYYYYTRNEIFLSNQPMLQMSNLTCKILQSLDYTEISNRRRYNFLFMKESLKDINLLDFELHESQVPMTYPFLSNNSFLRNILANYKIYTARYWENVLKWVGKDSIEYRYTSSIVHLPIDQRYNISDLERIVKIVRNEN